MICSLRASHLLSGLQTSLLSQVIMNTLPDTSLSPSPENPADGLAVGKRFGRASTLKASAIRIQNSDHYKPPAQQFSTTLRARRKQSSYLLPWFVTQICRIFLIIAAAPSSQMQLLTAEPWPFSVFHLNIEFEDTLSVSGTRFRSILHQYPRSRIVHQTKLHEFASSPDWRT